MQPSGTRLYRTLRQPRGMVLITAMWIAIALAAVVLVLCREMMVESITARQHLDQAKADAAELGMEQFVQSVLAQEMVTPGTKDQTDWELRQIGDCYVWVLTYNVDDESQPAFGLTDEAGKLDVNTSTFDMLMLLPGMTEDLAYQILDWVDADDDLAGGLEGAETPDYESATNYHAKNAPFETTDELRLLLDLQDPVVAEPLLHGADANHNNRLDVEEAANADPSLAFDGSSQLGLMPFVTTYGLRATTLPTASTAASSTTTSTVGGITDTSAPPTIADVNATSGTTVLQSVLQQYLPAARATAILNATTAAAGGAAGGGGGRGGAGGATTPKFKNIWDWATQMQTRAQLTSTEFGEIYLYVMCSPLPASTTQTSTTASPISSTATTAPATQPSGPVGRINIMSASLPVLMCLPGFEETDAQNIIDYREANISNILSTDPTQLPNIAWLMDQVDPTKLVSAGSYLTGSSTVYSADIVTVSPDGRAFKRVKIVVDVSSGTPQIIYRRDLTSEGWPLDVDVRTKLRSGGVPDRIGPMVMSGGAVGGTR